MVKILSVALMLWAGSLSAQIELPNPSQSEKPEQGFVMGDYAYANQAEFIQAGRRCATYEPTEIEQQTIEAQAREWLDRKGFRGGEANRATRVFPVIFNCIRNNAGTVGNVTLAQMGDQIDVLNDAFAGTGISFDWRYYRYIDNSSYFSMTLGSAAERAAKTALHVGAEDFLNIYTANPNDGSLGWATFPWDYTGDPLMDGIVLLYTSVPGGSGAPYDEGDTGVHEVGHWVGLFHTFQGGCSNPNDMVGDTPAHLTNFGCPGPSTNTCGLPGNDPVSNFMNYVDDACMDQFTAGQITRFCNQINAFR